MVLPTTIKEYEQYCEYVIVTRLKIMLIHIMGEKFKKRYVQHWKAIEDIRMRYLQRMFAL
jgi:hypothetical protein